MLNMIKDILYHKVFVNIIVKVSSCDVYIERLNKKGIVSSNNYTFDTTKIDDKMYDFIYKEIKETPFYYVSLLDTSLNQGAIPTCNKEKYDLFYDKSTSKYICYKDKWTYYTSKYDLSVLEKDFSLVGIDFIFSPIVILAKFFKDKIDIQLSIFVLVQEGCLTISIFDNSLLLFCSHLDTKKEIQDDHELVLEHDTEDVNLELEDDNSINLEDIDIEDIDELEEFGDIEDLDALDDIEEFTETDDNDIQMINEEEDSKAEEVVDDVNDFNDDYHRFLSIQSSIGNYYKDERYDNKFVENIYIADSVGVSSDLKRYLEEEMFLSVYIRQMDLSAEICDMAKEELK